MTMDIRFGDLTFDPGFLFARRAQADEVRFTRSERALLVAFTRHPGRILSRGQLLDALSGEGSDAIDRNVDFLINRLRGKLGDSARAPSFIATQYGEGYIWIAVSAFTSAPASNVLLLIGPVFGIERLGNSAGARAFLVRLQTALDTSTAADQRILLTEGLRRAELPSVDARFTLEISFFGDANRLDCACVLREGGSRNILRADRLDLADSAAIRADRLASELRKTMWESLSLPAGTLVSPTDEPLEVRLHNASLMLARSPETWVETQAQTARAFEERPDDPEAALCVGMSLYSRLLQNSTAEYLTPESSAHTENEIERLVFSSLPNINGNPILMLAAAKLLLFSGKGHIELARELAESALEDSTAFGSAFAVLGQIRVCAGELDAGLDLYERGIEIAEPGSSFHIYLLVLACVAHLASGKREELERVEGRLHAADPHSVAHVSIFLVPPEEERVPPVIARMLDSFDAKRARAALTCLYYISARIFVREEHRENLMRGLLAVTIRRFGAQVVPEFVWQCVPGLRPQSFSDQAAPTVSSP